MIEPGSAFPGDRASRSTPVARTREDVERLAGNAPTLAHLDGRSSVCRACPRLVAWREQVAEEKRAAFVDQVYWGRPVTGFGPERARVLVVGLAPAAHGANRTGRVFTGDRSGDFLYAALHRAGLANQPTSVDAHDGLELAHTRIVVPVRCAPPGNKPNNAERDTCGQWLAAELRFLLPWARVAIVLGGFGWDALQRALRDGGVEVPADVPEFGHGVEVQLPGGLVLLGSYHVSQQNTFTGRLTPEMFDGVVARAKEVAGLV